MFHGLAILLMGGILSGGSWGDGSDAVLVGQCQVDISLRKCGVGPGDVILGGMGPDDIRPSNY